MNVDTSYFIFPDEKSIIGSTALFSALLSTLSSKKLIAIVRFTRTKSSLPRVAALIPQLETLDNDGFQATPPGFHLVQLPFLEEIRRNPQVIDSSTLESVSLNNDLTESATNLINALQLNPKFVYFKDIESPSMQQFYSVLQAVALSSDQPEWNAAENDQMRPDKDGQLQHEDVIEAFREATGLNDSTLNEMAAAKPKKRAAVKASRAADDDSDVDGDGGAPKKKAGVKKAKPSGDSDEAMDYKEMASAGTLGKLTVVLLKEACSHLGLPVSGTKPVLVQRISESFGL